MTLNRVAISHKFDNSFQPSSPNVLPPPDRSIRGRAQSHGNDTFLLQIPEKSHGVPGTKVAAAGAVKTGVMFDEEAAKTNNTPSGGKEEAAPAGERKRYDPLPNVLIDDETIAKVGLLYTPQSPEKANETLKGLLKDLQMMIGDEDIKFTKAILKVVFVKFQTTPELADPAADIISYLLSSEKSLDLDEKKSTMEALANIYNEGGSSVEEKNAAVKVFEKVRDGENAAAFHAGLDKVTMLGGEKGGELTEGFLEEFLNNAAENKFGDYPESESIQKLFIDRLSAYSGKNTQFLFGTIIPKAAELWTGKSDNRILWDALVKISNFDVKNQLSDTTEQTAFDSVLTNVTQRIGEKEKVAGNLVLLIGKDFPKLHRRLMDIMIDGEAYPSGVRLAMLDALKALPSVTAEGKRYLPINRNEYAVSRVYLRIYMKNEKEAKNRAVKEGMAVLDTAKTRHILLKRLIDEDDLIRGHAHTLIKDNQTKLEGDGNKDSPLTLYGIKLIGEIEDISETAKTGEIKKECEKTIDYLYIEKRKRSHLINGSAVGMPAATLVTHGENAMGRDAHGAVFNGGWMTPELFEGGRIFVDGEYSFAPEFDSGSGLKSAGGFAGLATTLSGAMGDMSLKQGIGGSYIRLSGRDENRPDMPFEYTPAVEPNVYDVRALDLNTTVEGGAALYRLELATGIPFLKMRGDGREFIPYFIVGFDAGWFWGSVTDEACGNSGLSFDPRSGETNMTMIPNVQEQIYSTTVPAGKPCRNGESVHGPVWKARVGIGFDFHL